MPLSRNTLQNGISQPLFVEGPDFTDECGKREGGIAVVGIKNADSFHVDGNGNAGIEPEASRHKQTVRVADHETLNRRAAVPGDAEGALVERPEPAGPAPGPFGKDEDIAAGCKIFPDTLDILDHRAMCNRLPPARGCNRIAAGSS